EQLLRLVKRPQRLHPGQVGAGNRQAGGGGSCGDEQAIEGKQRTVAECDLLGLRVNALHATTDSRLDLQSLVGGIVGRHRMAAWNLAREPIGEGHTGMGRLVGDERDVRSPAVELTNRFEGVCGGRPTADNHMSRHASFLLREALSRISRATYFAAERRWLYSSANDCRSPVCDWETGNSPVHRQAI